MRRSQELISRDFARLVAVTAMTVVGTACSDRAGSAPRVPDAEGPQSLALYLAGAAANQLQPDGTLRINNVQTAGTRPQIDEDRAREIASAFIASHLQGLRAALEEDRGASIDVRTVSPCPRVFYAESAFEELPDDVPGIYHRMYGPWWLTTLCTPGGEPVVALGISAYATELGIAGGKLTYPDISGGEFRVVGIRPGDENLLPIPPEAAVRRAADMASRRIASVPRLVLRLPGSAYPQLAHWQLTLDSEAEFTIPGGEGSVRARDVFVGAEVRSKPRVRRAAPNQPDAIDVEWRPSAVIGQTRDTPLPAPRTTRLARRPEIPVVFDELERGGEH